ncbi:MAG: esterase family protein, partial [Anaerolineae bacterium]|nr:esterase family protein [Anaerolineae bacterium]
MPDQINSYLKTNSTPIIDNDLVTFVWKGKTAPHLVGDFTGWDEDKPAVMEKHSNGIWTYTLSFPGDAYIEYGYIKDGEPILDPHNPRKTSNGIGGDNNYFSMPGYRPSTLNRRKRNIVHGLVSRHELSTGYLIAGRKRTVHLYHPPPVGPVPLIVVWDGQDYLLRLRLNNMVDTLIAEGRLQPVALAFIDNAGEDFRTAEYACSDATLAFLMLEVLPLAKMELDLINIEQNPGAYGVLGASMGGLMAMYTG